MISKYFRSTMADQIQNAAVAAVNSPTGNQTGNSNASTLLGWSWEKWAKCAGYLETVIGLITVIIIPIFLAELSTARTDLVEDVSATKEFNKNKYSSFFLVMGSTVGISTSRMTESQYDYVKGYFITLLIIQVAYTILAVYMVVVVKKKNLKHILQGIFFKIGLLLLNVLFFFSQLIVLACCGYDSSILWRLFLIVGDGVFIIIMNNYFKCERDALAASNLNYQLPKFMSGMMDNIFTIKIPFLTKKP